MSENSPHPEESKGTLRTIYFMMALSAHVALGQTIQSGLSPAKVKQLAEINKGYQSCAQEVLKGVKAGTIVKTLASSELGLCRDRYPAVALFTECKKGALALKDKKQQLSEVATCKKILVSASFNENDPSPPFLLKGSSLYFGGVGLNGLISTVAPKMPNFSCASLAVASEDLFKASYLLFGNNALVFGTEDRGVTERKVHEKLQKNAELGQKIATKRHNPEVDVAGFGRFVFDSKRPSMPPVVYFPSATCDFATSKRGLYSGLSLHYLIDKPEKTGVPYFGIAYYKQGIAGIKTATLVDQMLARLGPGFKAYSKDKNTVYFAGSSFTEVDIEKDPKNICKTPRTHEFVGILKSQKGKTDTPEYLIVANVKNLCEYGDRLARRFGR